jgi:hypothetical protein
MITIFGVWISFWLFNYEHRVRDKRKEKNNA